jgi:hypothetical protein
MHVHDVVAALAQKTFHLAVDIPADRQVNIGFVVPNQYIATEAYDIVSLGLARVPVATSDYGHAMSSSAEFNSRVMHVFGDAAILRVVCMSDDGYVEGPSLALLGLRQFDPLKR